MARQRRRYLEGRLYMAWAAVALLLASWAGIAIHDQVERRTDAQPSSTESTSASAQSRVQTRTRGS